MEITKLKGLISTEIHSHIYVNKIVEGIKDIPKLTSEYIKKALAEIIVFGFATLLMFYSMYNYYGPLIIRD